jgi:hypothetical protein
VVLQRNSSPTQQRFISVARKAEEGPISKFPFEAPVLSAKTAHVTPGGGTLDFTAACRMAEEGSTSVAGHLEVLYLFDCGGNPLHFEAGQGTSVMTLRRG